MLLQVTQCTLYLKHSLIPAMENSTSSSSSSPHSSSHFVDDLPPTHTYPSSFVSLSRAGLVLISELVERMTFYSVQGNLVLLFVNSLDMSLLSQILPLSLFFHPSQQYKRVRILIEPPDSTGNPPKPIHWRWRGRERLI